MVFLSSRRKTWTPSHEVTNKAQEAGQGTSGNVKAEFEPHSLSLLNGVTLIVGNNIGYGIFITPKRVLLNTGSYGCALVVWLLAGLVSALGACCYAELGSTFPGSGDIYVHLRRTTKPIVSFVFCWAFVLAAYPASMAIGSLTVAKYVLQPFYGSCMPPDLGVRLLAVSLLCFTTAINSLSLSGAKKLQNVFAVSRCSSLVLVTVFGLAYLAFGNTEHFQGNIFEGSGSASGFALALCSCFFSYAGWSSMYRVTEELKDPHRTLPYAVVISTTTVTFLFVLANVSFIAVLGANGILQSDVVAVAFGSRLFSWLSWIMSVLVSLSAYGTLNSNVFSFSHVLKAVSKDEAFPEAGSYTHTNYHTPVPSLITQCCICLIYLAWGDLSGLISAYIFVIWSARGVAVFGLLYYRYRNPDLGPVAFKSPIIIPALFALFCVFLVVVTLYGNPVETGTGLAIILSGIPAYYLGKYLRENRVIYDQINLWTVKLLNATPNFS